MGIRFNGSNVRKTDQLYLNPVRENPRVSASVGVNRLTSLTLANKQFLQSLGYKVLV